MSQWQNHSDSRLPSNLLNSTSLLSSIFVLSSFVSVLLHLARNDYTLAHSTIHSLYSTHPFDIDVANNYAVCCLYVNLAQDGINALENLVRKDPIKSVNRHIKETDVETPSMSSLISRLSFLHFTSLLL